ncbi:hypothetical protein [Acetobacter pasteurianus]|nr:hypothetical protein [Acetobacter pasteurianus]
MKAWTSSNRFCWKKQKPDLHFSAIISKKAAFSGAAFFFALSYIFKIRIHFIKYTVIVRPSFLLSLENNDQEKQEARMTAFGAYWLQIQNSFRKLLHALHNLKMRKAAHIKH